MEMDFHSSSALMDWTTSLRARAPKAGIALIGERLGHVYLNIYRHARNLEGFQNVFAADKGYGRCEAVWS